MRFVEAGEADGETDGTRLFAALNAALADVPPDRIAGAIMITDGRVHDIPAEVAALGFDAPVHALITGQRNERDRRVVLVTTPRFGIVGQSQTIVYRVDDQGVAPDAGRGHCPPRRRGAGPPQRHARQHRQCANSDPARRSRTSSRSRPRRSPDELTAVNNRAVVSIDGVRDKLRVLLVSGEPHAGERTWRNLLKSDASVDLVHFTILRPPEKQDGTPINELSLIAFPTRELFQQKIKDFHLIIFDRYARQGVLPMIYFDNIARYVREGGAVLVAAGPDYASPTSIWRTPLETILPAEPSGKTVELPYRAELTDAGRRHPVTRGLRGADTNPPHWSRWFRLVDTRAATTAPRSWKAPTRSPLLVLAREGEGRVGLLLSDHIWLWARGYEGGGPHLDLMRRLSHWLMKQPDLEEEALRLIVRGRDLAIERQTMADTVSAVTLTLPSGATRTIVLQPGEPGLWHGSLRATELGLWRATDGKLSALVNVGPPNPREFAEVTSTTQVLAPFTALTGGDTRRIAAASGVALPRVVGMRSSDAYKGSDWIGLRMQDASVVRGIGVLPMFAGLLGLLLLVGALAATWAREGR